MKKVIIFLTAITALITMSFSAIADDGKGQEMEVKIFVESEGKYYFADTNDSQSDDIRIGNSKNIAFSDLSEFRSINSSGSNLKFGIMLVDDENGTGFVTYRLSDVTIKSGENTYTLSTEGDYSGNLSNGIYEDDTALIHEIDMSDKADILENLEEITEISLSVTYKSYDSNEPQSAESETEDEEFVNEMPNPSTGVLSALMIPTLASLSVIAAKKKK